MSSRLGQHPAVLLGFLIYQLELVTASVSGSSQGLNESSQRPGRKTSALFVVVDTVAGACVIPGEPTVWDHVGRERLSDRVHCSCVFVAPLLPGPRSDCWETTCPGRVQNWEPGKESLSPGWECWG